MEENPKKLAYDIGGFDGEDTARYLKLGYKVVCIEAAPSQAAQICKRFDREIAIGDCIVLNVAIGPEENTLPFYICRENGALNSFDRSRLDNAGLTAQEVNIPVLPLLSIFERFGRPYFLKVDIEGSDRHAILPLTKGNAPEFLSFEACDHDLDLILHLLTLGYTRFNLIRQDTHKAVRIPSIGSASYVGWAARQWQRKWLRAHPILHNLARKTRQSLSELKSSHGAPTSGLTPMEQKLGWRCTEDFLADWFAARNGGIIGSAWFDVHAARR